MLDAEQQRRISELETSEQKTLKERSENQALAVQQMEDERTRRSSLTLEADLAAELEQQRNRKSSIELQEAERKSRIEEDGTKAKPSPLKGCFNALKSNVKSS